MTNQLKEIKKLMIELTNEAGDYALAYFKTVKLEEVRYKKGLTSPVTVYDVEIDNSLRTKITSAFPEHSIISEENQPYQGADKNITWIIDPIDGTNNYIKGIELFSVSIAVMIDGQIVMGTIYSPALNKFYFVERGKGVLLNDKPLIREANPASVCYHLNLKHLFEKVEALFPKENITREHLHCTSVEFSRLAENKVKCAIYENIELWDFAAGVLMVEEAGGRVVDFDNKPYTTESRNLIVFSNS